MIKYIKNTTLYIIAFLLFLFGNTVNVIHFCCDLCRTQGTEVFTKNNCHDSEKIESVAVKYEFANTQVTKFDHMSRSTNHRQNLISDSPFVHEIKKTGIEIRLNL